MSKLTYTEIVNLHINEKMSTSKIAELAGITDRGVRYILKKMGVQPIRWNNIKNNINLNFFKQWSNEMAYILGLIYTDGCLHKNTLSISQKDPEILYKINKIMNSNYKLYKNKKTGVYTLNISRKEIVEDLYKLGVTPKKSTTISFPKIPGQFLSHFIRGIYDGDGWVQDRNYVANITTASKTFAEGLLQTFKEIGLNSFVKEGESKNNKIYRVWISGKDDVRNFYKYIYNNTGDLYIKRKKDRFKESEI